LDPIGGGDGAAGGVGNAQGETRQRRRECCRHAAEQLSAIDLHQINSSLFVHVRYGTGALNPLSVMETRQTLSLQPIPRRMAGRPILSR
jgi:hypothetical protein